MSKFIRLLACLFTFVFIGSAYGAGYMCNNNKKYTACADRYYPSQCGSKRDGSTVAAVVGGSCLECPSGHTCSGSNLNCPLATNISVTCSAGKYIKSGTTTCSQSCPAGKYCTAGTFTIPATGAKSDTGNIYNCPSGYTSDAGAQANTWCYVKCAPGTRVVKAGGTCTTPAGPWYMWGTTVFYGNVSHVVHCMNGFTNTSTSASNHTEMGNCTRSVSAGQYIASGFQQARYIRVSTSGNSVNSAGLHVAEIQAYSDRFGNGTNYLAGVKTGTGTNLGNATDGNWKRIPYAEGGSTLTWDMGAIKEIGSIKLALYADGRTYRAVTVSVSTNNSTWTTVMAPVDIVTSVRAGANETVDPEWIILSGSLASCPAGKYSVASTSDLQNPVSSCTACAIGSYSAAGASRCTACSGGKTTTATGQSSCNATCTNATGANIWAAPTWLPNSVTDKCTIESCSTGYVHGGTANSTGASSYTCSVGTYTITLNNNGGSGGAGSVKEVYKTKWTNSAGTTITSVAIPTRSGYVFNGYYTEASGGTRYITNTGALPANTTFVASRTLYAQWTAATCSKGTGVSSATASVSSNRVSCAVTCSTGYSQSGGTNTTTSFTVTGAAGVATVATACKIRTATCSAGYHLAAGAVACSACPAGKYCAGSSTAFSYNASTAQGITGACASGGWSAGGASNSACTTCLTSGNCGACPTGYSYNSATGKTARNQCRIQCAAGTRVASANATCTTPNNSGYTWGWYISQHVVNAGSLSSGISTCSAGYTTPNTTTQTDHDSSADCKAISYTITYNQNSGTGCANSTYTVAAAKTLCTPSRTGYTFGGWFTNSGLTGSAVSSIAAGTTGNKEYWAKWTANSFTVVYDLNNGTGTKPGNKACTYNAACALDAGTGTSYYRAGYVLKGWSTNKAATSGSFDGKNLATSGTVTVYAIWAGCAAGTAKAAGVAAATACSTCAAGTYTSVAGQASCAACPAGKYCTGGTNVTNCGVGTHRNATGGKTASDCAACSGSLQFQDAAGQTSCKTVSTGYYKASNSAQVQCDAGYRDIAATSRNECVGTFSKTGFVLDPALPTNCASQTLGTATAKTCSYTKKFSGTIVKDCTPENVTKPRTGLSAKAGYYTSGTTSCLACGGNGYYCAGGTASRQTVSAGYYSTGGTETTRTGQSQCTGSTYCTGGVKNNCPAAESNWTLGTGNGWSAVTSCFETRNATSVSSYCSAGQLKKNATSSGTWPTASTTSVAFQAKAGSIVSGQTCTQCSGAVWSAGGTATSCSSCPAQTSGWTRATGTGWGSVGSCYQTRAATAVSTYCSAGQLKQTGKSTTEWNASTISVAFQAKAGSIVSGQTCTQCSGAVWSAGGTATSCSSCPPQTSGWTRATGTGWGSVGSCYQTRAATAVSTYCSAGQLKQTGKSTTEWNASTISVAFQAKAGSIVSGQTCTQCSGAVWSAGGTATSCSSCPAQTSGWARNTGTGWSAVTQCNQTKSVGGNCSAGMLRQNATSTTVWGGSTISTALQAKPGYIVSGQTCTGCSAGTYSAGGTATSCSACTTRAKYSGANASACTNVSSGYYTTGCNTSGNNCTGQSQCTGSTYCTGGVKNNCPAAESNWTLGTGNGWSAVTSCFETRNATSVSSYCSAGQLKKNATSSGTWPTASTTSVAFQAKAGSIVSGQTCTQCSGAVWSAGGTATSCSSCPAQTSGWTRATGTGWGSVGSCYQTRAATAVSTYCSAGQLKQTGKSTTEWNASTISVAFQAKAGSIVSGQTCTQCSGAVWSAGGTATSCSSCPANYGANTATGKTAASQCQTSCAAGYAVQEANKACAIVPSGYQTGTHKVNYGSTTPKAADSTSPAVGTWYSCLTNYSATGSAATNHDARSDCKINCGAGTRIASANATSCTTPSGNWWIGAHTVAAGSASSVSNCNSGYSISGTAATDHDAAADCKISCGGGYYIPTAGGGCKACPAGKYCTGGAKAQTETLAATGNCPAGTYSTGGATSSACTAALSGYTAAVCGANQYSTVGASGCTACATAKGYTNSGTTAAAHAGIASCKASCSGTQYVATAGAGCVTVGGGYYGRQASSTSVAQDALLGRTQCPTGYRDGAAASTESGCIMNVAGGKYVAAAKESAASGTCSPGYAKAAHNVNYGSTSSCAACTGATYAASAGQASCTQCPTATNSTDVTGYAYWNGGVANDHTVREGCYAIFKGKTVPNGTMSAYKCYIDKDTNNYGIVKKDRNCWVEAADLKCNGGYYNVAANGGATQPGGTTLENLWNTACVNVGAGYWSATNALTRTACASGLTTIGYGAGADEAGDCGRVMRFGDSKLYLRSTKKTTPSLNVKIGDKTFYGNMSTSTKGKLRIKKDATTYSVHDDSM